MADFAQGTRLSNLQNNDVISWNSSVNAFVNRAAGGTGGVGTITSISAGPSITTTPNPITTTGSVDINNSLWLGNKATTPVSKQGIIDVCETVGAGSDYSGIAATGNSVVNLGNNLFSGPAKAVLVAGGGGGGGATVTVNNVQSSVIEGISHTVSNSTDMLVGGYLQTVTNTDNSLSHGHTNTVSDCNAVSCLGFQNSITNSDYCAVDGYQNLVVDSFATDVKGLQNSVTAGHTTSVDGYQNTFTGLATTANNSIWGFSGLYPSNIYRFCDFRGYNISCTGSTNHEGLFLYANGDPTGTVFDNAGSGIKVPSGFENNGSGNIFSNWLNFGCNTAGDMRFHVKAPVCNIAPSVGDSLCNKTYVDSVATGLRSVTSQDYYYNTFSTGGTIGYQTSGGNQQVAISPLSTSATYQFDPFSLTSSPGGFGKCEFTNAGGPTSRRIRTEFTCSIIMNQSNTDTDLGASYSFYLYYNGATDGLLSMTNGNALNAPNGTGMTQNRIQLSGFYEGTYDISLGYIFEIVILISGSDDATHSLQINRPTICYTVRAQ